MTLKKANLVLETSTTEGTGMVSLGGAASGYRAFAEAYADGDLVAYYCIRQDKQYETGIGTYRSATNTLERTLVIGSSSAGAAINFGPGTKEVCVALPMEMAATFRSLPQSSDAGRLMVIDADGFLVPLNRDLVATVSGTANALTLSTAPAATSWINNDVVRFVAASDNGAPGPVTVAINGGAVVTLKKESQAGLVDLVQGDIKGGGEYSIVRVGTGWVLSDPAPLADPATLRSTLSVYSKAEIDARQVAYRNLLIGGDFTTNPWVRGTSANPVANVPTYIADRFYMYQSGGSTGGYTVSKQAFGVLNCLRISWNNSGAPAGTQRFAQIVEGINVLAVAGQQVTLQIKLRRSASWTQQVSIFVYAGTVADEGSAQLENGAWTGITTVASATVTLTTSMTTYTITGTVPANAQELAFKLHWEHAAMAVGAYIETAQIQLEPGPSATAFEALPADEVLKRCQRFAYARSSVAMLFSPSTANYCGQYLAHPVPMRAAPTITLSNQTYSNCSNLTYDTLTAAGGRYIVQAASAAQCSVSASIFASAEF